ELIQADRDSALVMISTPSGAIERLGSVRIIGRTLRIDAAHVDGSGRGAIRRAGLNAIGDKLLEAADVDEIILKGGSRTTGRNQGRPPKPFRYPR
ncbi:MAG TPA: hypothetical protein VHK66_05140, partial [Microvirga sp.]|nr:hypothetical protein [Microvirga sp.]